MISVGAIFIENLVELLLGLIVTFNVAAYSFLWKKVQNVGDETDKNSETLNVILHRIFGIEQDPTDEGYIMETENRFDKFGDKLEEIAEKQNEACESRGRMEEDIQSIMEVLEREEKVTVKPSDFND